MLVAQTQPSVKQSWRSVANAEIFGISVLVSDNDCDRQPSYEYCGEGTRWF